MHSDHTIPTKVCPKCQIDKPATTEFFGRAQKEKDGLSYVCKICRADYMRAYEQTNRERRAEYRKSRRAITRPVQAERDRIRYQANKDIRREYNRAYYYNNQERLLANRKTPEIREVRRLQQRQRRSIQSNAEGTHSQDDVQKQYAAQKGNCYYCHCNVGETYHVDHVIPLTRGGSNGPENIVIACPTCNISKRDRLPSEWPKGGRLL